MPWASTSLEPEKDNSRAAGSKCARREKSPPANSPELARSKREARLSTETERALESTPFKRLLLSTALAANGIRLNRSGQARLLWPNWSAVAGHAALPSTRACRASPQRV